jgi:hypothetical protein
LKNLKAWNEEKNGSVLPKKQFHKIRMEVKIKLGPEKRWKVFLGVGLNISMTTTMMVVEVVVIFEILTILEV